MPHLFRYKLAQGDVLTYDQEVTLLLEEPDGSKYTGLTREESVQSVSEDHGGWWTILLSLTRVSSSGPLCDEIPEQLRNRSTLMQMDCRGSLLDIGSGGPPPPRVPAFPMDEVSPGQSWTAIAQAPEGGEPLEIEFNFERVEVRENGEEIGHLLTLAHSKMSNGYRTETQGTVAFSLTHGHQVTSTTVVKMIWDNGRISHSVVDLKLRSRVTA